MYIVNEWHGMTRKDKIMKNINEITEQEVNEMYFDMVREYCEFETKAVLEGSNIPLGTVLERIANRDGSHEAKVELFAGLFKVYHKRPMNPLKLYDRLYLEDKQVLGMPIHGIGYCENGLVQIMI